MKVRCFRCHEPTGHGRITKVHGQWMHKQCVPRPRPAKRPLSRKVRQRFVVARQPWTTRLRAAFLRSVEKRSRQ